MSLTADDEKIPLEGFQVVAVPGKGVWITDNAGHYWHVGGPAPDQQEDNLLAKAYREAVSSEREAQP